MTELKMIEIVFVYSIIANAFYEFGSFWIRHWWTKFWIWRAFRNKSKEIPQLLKRT